MSEKISSHNTQRSRKERTKAVAEGMAATLALVSAMGGMVYGANRIFNHHKSEHEQIQSLNESLQEYGTSAIRYLEKKHVQGDDLPGGRVWLVSKDDTGTKPDTMITFNGQHSNDSPNTIEISTNGSFPNQAGTTTKLTSDVIYSLDSRPLSEKTIALNDIKALIDSGRAQPESVLCSSGSHVSGEDTGEYIGVTYKHGKPEITTDISTAPVSGDLDSLGQSLSNAALIMNPNLDE